MEKETAVGQTADKHSERRNSSAGNPKITLELYAQAVSADQQDAHKKVVQMMLPAAFSEKLKARTVTATS